MRARHLGRGRDRDPLDCLFVLDREVKHEALPIAPEDVGMGSAFRDVLTFEVR